MRPASEFKLWELAKAKSSVSRADSANGKEGTGYPKDDLRQ